MSTPIPPRLLGAILAGGASTRFGSDKALAEIDGEPMLARIAARLAGQVTQVAVVGRDWPGLPRIDDRPAPGLGPLGALAGALAYAIANGFDAVLTTSCDLPDLPRDLAATLGEGPAVIDGQPTIGLWPVTLLAKLDAHLAATDDRSLRAWILASGARAVDLAAPLANINRPADLAAWVTGKSSPARGGGSAQR